MAFNKYDSIYYKPSDSGLFRTEKKRKGGLAILLQREKEKRRFNYIPLFLFNPGPVHAKD
jgi:hypothetical protein